MPRTYEETRMMLEIKMQSDDRALPILREMRLLRKSSPLLLLFSRTPPSNRKLALSSTANMMRTSKRRVVGAKGQTDSPSRTHTHAYVHARIHTHPRAPTQKPKGARKLKPAAAKIFLLRTHFRESNHHFPLIAWAMAKRLAGQSYGVLCTFVGVPFWCLRRGLGSGIR